MITGGIDIGAESIKVVILKDNQIAGYSIMKAGFELQQSSEKALEQALSKANLSRSDVSNILSTGTGRKEATFAKDGVSEIVADARGGVWLAPQARTVIDVGNEQALGIRCDAAGKVVAYGKNDKCAAGVGAFVQMVARTLEVSVEQMGPLSLQSDRDISLNFTCAVFAETEVVSLIHAKMSKPDIARGVHDAIAVRISSMVGRVGMEKEVMLVGGVAKNAGVVDRLKHHLGTEIFVPEEPQIVAALGAALIARD